MLRPTRRPGAFTRLTTFTTLVLAALLVLTAQVGQAETGDAIIKTFETEDASEFVLHRSEISGSEGQVELKFVFEVYSDDEYFITAWARTVGEQENLEVLIDGIILPEPPPFPIADQWQSITLAGPDQQPAPVYLTAGEHELVFAVQDSVAPHIDEIRVSRDLEMSRFPADNYMAYLEQVDQATIPDDHYSKDEIPEEEISASKARVMKASLAPQGDYMYDLGFGFTYTYYGYYYLTAGQQVQFQTSNPNPWGSDPVMYLFSYFNPAGASWSNDDGAGGFQSRIVATPPTSGWYMLLLRGFGNSAGFSDILYNGRIVVPRAVIGGRYDYCSALSKSGQLNYFTSHLTGDSRIWLMDSNGFPGLVKAHNDDYWGSGSFYWGLASRVKASISPQAQYAILGTYSAWNPTATADVYLKLSNSGIMTYFPNLNADDAIQSAPVSSAYNCISWSGGRADLGRFFWPPNAGNPWQGPTALASFDNFYGNKDRNGLTLVRFNGAMNYSRVGATSSNSVVDLWALSGSYTHGSVRKQGDNHPHGYDWESKPGGLERTFHPRNALNGSSYGSVVAYYRWTGTYSYGTPPMKGDGPSAGPDLPLDTVSFSEKDLARLSELVQAVSPELRERISERYEAWRATWSDPELEVQSNPRMFARSPEYFAYLDLCSRKGRQTWPLVLERLVQGDELVINALEDLTFKTSSHLMTGILEDNVRNADTVLPSQTTNWRRYAIRLIDSLYTEYAETGALR